MFYPDVKKHLSPSAHATWHNSKSAFFKSYFKGERSKETSSMLGGTKIHGLIEGGFLKAQVRYDHHEITLEKMFRDTGTLILGTPDSYGMKDGRAEFVDYKSGRENTWTREELAGDIKMRTTAWLVWKELGEPEEVMGYIHWFGTEWDGEAREVIPSDNEYALVKCLYTGDEMRAFENIIAKTIEDVNKAWEQFNSATENFVDEMLAKEYADLDAEVKAKEEEHIAPLKAKMSEIRDTLAEQMEFGQAQSYEADFGTFYWRTTAKYDYPSTLKFQLPNGEVHDLEYGEQVTTALSAVKKHYEKENDPIDEKKSLQFRGKKKK